MPQPTANIDKYRNEITFRIMTLKQKHKDIIKWLESEGTYIEKRTLIRRCKTWGVSRRATAALPDILNQINVEFHSTTDRDEDIAKTLNTTLNAHGVKTTANQIKEVRLEQGWRHRNNILDQQTEQRADTFLQVGQLLDKGTTRSYGREFMRTNLLVEHGHRARDADLKMAIRTLDPEGTEARKPGINGRGRMSTSYLVPIGYGQLMGMTSFATLESRSMPQSMPTLVESSGYTLATVIGPRLVFSDSSSPLFR